MKAQLRTPSPSRRTARSVAGLVALFAALGMALGSCATQPPSPGLTPIQVQPENTSTAQPPMATGAATEVSPDLRPMRERKFWEIIDRSREASAGDTEQQASAMEATLATMKPTEIASFNATFIEKNNELYTWELWGAVYVLYGGCSDDCFDYFRSWVVGQGRDYYKSVQRDPLVLGDGRLAYSPKATTPNGSTTPPRMPTSAPAAAATSTRTTRKPLRRSSVPNRQERRGTRTRSRRCTRNSLPCPRTMQDKAWGCAAIRPGPTSHDTRSEVISPHKIVKRSFHV